MNILPKKSWHVRNKDNIEKVRRDEQEAREKELEEARRSAKAEQEARTNFLRRRAAARDNKAVSSADGLQVAVVADDKATSSSSKMVQLFQANDERVGNSEHASEKRAEKEKWERKLGVLTYLGESSVELKGKQDKPWYFHAPSTTEGGGAIVETDAKRKASLDPLNDLNKYVKRKRKEEEEVEKKRKKHKKKKSKSSSNKLEQLRQARLDREEREKARTDRLLNKGKSKDSSDDEKEMDLRNRAYNNQFNPHLAKKRFAR